MDVKEDELVIDSSNFDQHFFDVRKNKPKKGQVMAKFNAIAVFGSGQEKMDIINLVKTDKIHQASQVMQRIHLAKAPDCYKVLREICEDLYSGMSDEEVNEKEYEFVVESIFYTQKENVPKNDPHWETLDVIKYDSESNKFICNIQL